MPYNRKLSEEKRRGLYRKTRKAQKKSMAHTRQQASLEHNGLYPYMLRFIEYSAVKGLTASTVKTRERGLQRFIAWCDERGLDDPRSITRPIVERYQKYLFYYRKPNGEPLGHGTQMGLLIAVKNFFKWLTRENYLLFNPASELETPKPQRRLPKAILTQDEVERVLLLADTQTVYGLRDRAILETFYSTGLRRMEVVNLDVYDVDLNNKTVLVREGKGRKDRWLPLGARAAYWITRYQEEARGEFMLSMDERALFLTDYGERWLKNRLSDMVKKYFYHAGIHKTGACHLFRHAMATHMLDNGADIRFIQQMLGHSDLSTTQIYTQVSIEKLRDIHTATHPAKLDNRDTWRAELESEMEEETDVERQ